MNLRGKRVTLHDMSLRDGMHPKQHRISLDQMVAVATALDEAGMPLIEADLLMLVCHNGQERTLAEYEELLVREGFRLESVGETGSYNLIAASAAPEKLCQDARSATPGNRAVRKQAHCIRWAGRWCLYSQSLCRIRAETSPIGSSSGAVLVLQLRSSCKKLLNAPCSRLIFS